MSGKTKGILIGGLAMGLISAIPIVGWLWIVYALLGGALAAMI